MDSHMFSQHTLYKAFIKKDTQFEGVAYAGIKTTGIFCRLSCTARKARAENVKFFLSVREAIHHGYRPCKICLPLEPVTQEPAHIRRLLEEVTQDTSRRITDVRLKEKGLDPVQVRRWFLKHYGLTFQAFQRHMRVNQAITMMQQGEKILNTAYEIGYDSVSGFAHTVKQSTGLAPSITKHKKIITTGKITTPLGPMTVAAVDTGICFLGFSDQKRLEAELCSVEKHLNARILTGSHHYFALVNKQLSEYFAGERTTFSIPLVTPGTAFQIQVWQTLLRIPYGETRSYQEQSILIGKPQAVRAVAQANGRNRIAILIPCHRVIGSNGTLTGYGAGLSRKEWLITHESKALE